jgi:serine/threonine protein kinase
MELKPGDKLGPYEILSALGKGGMGEVWKARDARLNRDVAVKVSARQFTDRFEREARAIAALNHPNICTLYDVGPNYLVMELVDGPTLSERMAQGRVPLEEALGIAKQIADALEAAHDKSIVHRDLKPANIKIKPDGSVKVLDFGLAKAGEAQEMMSDSPTMMPVQGTQMGMILGTAGYMAPEQARGQTVDKRADIWAFGIVLYEIVTGKRLFDAPTVTDSLAAILTKEPDLTLAPEKTRRLLAGCLEKNPRKRLRDIGDWTALLDTDRLSAAPPQSRFRLGAWVTAGLFTLIAAALAFLYFRQTPQAVRQTVFSTIPAPEKVAPAFLALSPDGRNLVAGDTRSLSIRALDSPHWRQLSSENPRSPFWSPDSKSIAFFANRKLKTIAAAGGPTQSLCDLTALGSGGTWNSEGTILFSDSSSVLTQVKASGGPCTPLTSAEPRVTGVFPTFLPDSKHFLYERYDLDEAKRGIWLGSLDPQKGADPRGHRLLADLSTVSYTPALHGSRYGHILFLRGTSVVAQPFDERGLQLAGDPFPVGEQVSRGADGQLDVTADASGTLAFAANLERETRLVWMDRTGKEIAKVGSGRDQIDVALSPDGKNVAIMRSQDQVGGVWLLNLTRDSASRLAERAASPVWAPDGKSIVYTGAPSGGDGLYASDATGGGQEVAVLKNGHRQYASDWSRDGRFLLYTEVGPKTGSDIWYLENPLGKNGPGKPVLFLGTNATESQAQFSPDGHWVAYDSGESGKSEIYIRPFPSGSGQIKVSSDVARDPRWSPDGKEIYYLASPGGSYTLMAAAVRPGRDGTLDVGVSQPLFEFHGTGAIPTLNIFLYSPAPGGRFLVNIDADKGAPVINLITNWQKLAPSRN